MIHIDDLKDRVLMINILQVASALVNSETIFKSSDWLIIWFLLNT